MTESFWLPDEPKRRIPGTLTFDSDGLALQLHDSLLTVEVVEGQAARLSLEWQTVPAVHGRLHTGPDVTLLEVSGISVASPFIGTWRVDFLLSGGHLTDDVFDQALFDFDVLMPWTGRPESRRTATARTPCTRTRQQWRSSAR